MINRSIVAIAFYCSLLVFVGGISVLMQGIDPSRAGWNSKETILTPTTVPKLRLLGTIPTGSIPCTTQILYYEKLNLNGHTNVLFCWGNINRNNGNITVMAFDADTFVLIWSLYIGQSSIWGTHAPAIDPVTNIIYGVLKKDNFDGLNYLVGIDILTGKQIPGSPLLINATVPGTGSASVGGQLAFATGGQHSDCRTSILILKSIIYFGFGTFGDVTPYHGWAFAYQYDTTRKQFVQHAAFCTTPNGKQGGIWAASHGIASDGNFIYLTTGNGDFNPAVGSLSMAAIKLTLDLKPVDYFVPTLWSSYSSGDKDLGSCGIIVLPNTQYAVVAITKYGAFHLIDTNNMGKFNASHDACRQTVSIRDGVVFPGGNPVAWDNGKSVKVYAWHVHNPLIQFTYNPVTQLLETPNVTWADGPVESNQRAGLVVTSNGAQDAVLWAWSQSQNGIYAFDATKDISTGPIWHVKQNGPNAWSWPTITNGKVYLNAGDSKIYVYGL